MKELSEIRSLESTNRRQVDDSGFQYTFGVSPLVETRYDLFFQADETANNTRAEGRSIFSLYFSKFLFRSLERRQGSTAPSPGHDPRARGPPERLRRPGDVRVPPRQPPGSGGRAPADLSRRAGPLPPRPR